MYLGTNQGLFVKSLSHFLNDDPRFDLVKNTGGQVWSLGIFDDQLICGHNLGTFLIKNNETNQTANIATENKKSASRNNQKPKEKKIVGDYVDFEEIE